ncbi:S1 family peptidase [Streptomyces sasae]|uniref:S1 family peptidase n=1 Tax=Streptomyces sasae TaxID=1266772 RepID=UPI0029315E19|nr:S1 family peptidase [Streptomyces sasae]
MRHARRRVVRRGTQLAAVGGLLLGGAMVTTAMASETPGTSAVPFSSATEAGDTGTALVTKLGTARTAGSWIGADGKPVVAVTDEQAAAMVKQAGAEPKMVSHSMNALKAATATLRAAPRVAGTAWAVDYRTNRVMVEADSTVSASDWAALKQVAAGIGGFVQMQRTGGTFTPRLNGAQPILSTGGRCSAGFNVTNGQTDFILTAGHCGPANTIWFDEGQGGNQQLGTTINTQFPGNDFSLIQYANGKAGDNADVVAIGNGQGVRITGSADPTVGQKVFRSGSTSGLHDGTVTALNATVNYPEGTVTGLIQTNVCAEPGDSGGPLFSEGIALGVTSGGSGDCTTGGVTFFQPVTRAMAALNVQLIVTKQAATGTQGASAAPSASATHSTIAPSAASPGSTAAVGSSDTSLVARLTDTRNVGPGLLVIGGSLIALVGTRYFRAEQDRKAYQRYYSATWG